MPVLESGVAAKCGREGRRLRQRLASPFDRPAEGGLEPTRLVANRALNARQIAITCHAVTAAPAVEHLTGRLPGPDGRSERRGGQTVRHWRTAEAKRARGRRGRGQG
jgi:hypothetical protein